jgi:hypothetical protein
VEISGDTDVKEEEGRSSNGEEQNYENRDWFAILLEVSLIYFQHANFVLFSDVLPPFLIIRCSSLFWNDMYLDALALMENEKPQPELIVVCLFTDFSSYLVYIETTKTSYILKQRE